MTSIKLQEHFFRFIKFGIAGFIGLVIDFSITWLIKEKLNGHKYVASAIGFIISATVNFFINRIWTFHNHDPHIMEQLGKFFMIAVIGLGINTSVLYYVHHNRKQNFYLAKLLATAVTVFWNFTGNTLFTFN